MAAKGECSEAMSSVQKLPVGVSKKDYRNFPDWRKRVIDAICKFKDIRRQKIRRAIEEAIG